jgi:aryl-alcohol dehydrogenase (NADP+)
VLHQPGITSPIIGASKPHHLTDALSALEIRLDDAELRSLTELYQTRPIMAHS